MENADLIPSDEHLRAIGLVTMLWSHIERALEATACHLYQIDLNRGLVFTANIGFQSRVAMVRIPAIHGAITDATLQAECLRLLRETETAYPLRNDVVHSIWRRVIEKPEIARKLSIRAKGSHLRCTVEDKEAGDIERVAETLSVLLAAWRILLERVGVFDIPKKS